jgi:hypothetical protein
MTLDWYPRGLSTLTEKNDPPPQILARRMLKFTKTHLHLMWKLTFQHKQENGRTVRLCPFL